MRKKSKLMYLETNKQTNNNNNNNMEHAGDNYTNCNWYVWNSN